MFRSGFRLQGTGNTLSDTVRKGNDPLAMLALKAVTKSRAYSLSSNLEGSGFWTSTTMVSPLVHAAGLVATIPSAFFLISETWHGTKRSRGQILFALPLNLLPN